MSVLRSDCQNREPYLPIMWNRPWLSIKMWSMSAKSDETQSNEETVRDVEALEYELVSRLEKDYVKII